MGDQRQTRTRQALLTQPRLQQLQSPPHTGMHRLNTTTSTTRQPGNDDIRNTSVFHGNRQRRDISRLRTSKPHHHRLIHPTPRRLHPHPLNAKQRITRLTGWR
ncbi:hypothetical protein, partial [Mycolicibacterium iranicum]|uniref:hypothetical protein n=1 Tax=Mycolicibacterium iranicum TaxID=912594 RepID=UPI001A992310